MIALHNLRVSPKFSLQKSIFQASLWLGGTLAQQVLENNVRITAKLFKLNFQEGRNFSILIKACGALSLRVDRVPL